MTPISPSTPPPLLPLPSRGRSGKEGRASGRMQEARSVGGGEGEGMEMRGAEERDAERGCVGGLRGAD